jgi:hypothetical protein
MLALSSVALLSMTAAKAIAQPGISRNQICELSEIVENFRRGLSYRQGGWLLTLDGTHGRENFGNLKLQGQMIETKFNMCLVPCERWRILGRFRFGKVWTHEGAYRIAAVLG